MSIVDAQVRRNMIDRVQKICLSPDSEWNVIEHESATTGSLLTGYVLPLAAIGAIAGFIGRTIIGVSLPLVGSYRFPFGASLTASVLNLVLTVAGVFVCGAIIDALAPTFGAQKNSMQAMKIAAYAPTPAWVAGVLQIIPALGALAILGALYSLYLLYLGLPKLMKCPQEKAIGYTVVSVVCFFVVFLVIGAVTAMVIGNPLTAGLVQ
jgi:hypothetical protein